MTFLANNLVTEQIPLWARVELSRFVETFLSFFSQFNNASSPSKYEKDSQYEGR